MLGQLQGLFFLDGIKLIVDRDHVELPDDYLEKAAQIYDMQRSNPVAEAVRGELRPS